MHVCVEKSVPHGLPKEGLDHDASKLRQIVPALTQRSQVRQMNSVDPFDGENVFGRVVPVDGRNTEIGVFARILGVFGGSRRLQPEVHLHLHRTRQRLHDVEHAQPSRLARITLRQRCCEVHVAKVAPESPLDAGTQDFNRHVTQSIGRRDFGAVNLRDRRRRDGLAEFRENSFEPRAERGFDCCDSLLARKRRDAILQFLQLRGRRDADDVRSGREELPELDV